MYRQGDVLIVPIRAMPKNVKAMGREKGRAVLAHGEATGHAHTVRDARAALFSDPRTMEVFMLVGGDDPVALEHEEHNTINIPAGAYQIVRQREYSPGAVRNVAD